MGVTSLWQILEPVKQHVPLSSLKGKTLAVDLSLWVCEAQTVKKMIGVVTKPHLRWCLEMLECLGIPWVQAAGEAEAMCAYLNANGYVDGCITNDGDAFLYGAQTVYRNFTMNVKRVTINYFSQDPHVDCYSIAAIEEKLGCSRESLIGLAVLLGCDYLPKGVPGVGKEQALKLIRTLRGQSLLQRFEHWLDDFRCSDNPVTAVKKVIHCAVCRHPAVQAGKHLNMCRDPIKIMNTLDVNFVEVWGTVNPTMLSTVALVTGTLLNKSTQWRMALERYEKPVSSTLFAFITNFLCVNFPCRKAKTCEGFPFPEVIQEYLINKDKQLKLNVSQRPNLLSFQRFAVEKMDWTKRYACEKLCALLTYYDMNRRKSGHVDPQQLQARRIIKTRTKHGVPCFEIEWQMPEHYATEDDQLAEPFFITIAESSLFQAAYPEIVALYQVEKLEICKAKKKGKKTTLRERSAEDSEVADLLSRLKLQSACETFPDSESKFESETAFKNQTLPKNESLSQGPNVAGNVSATVVKNQSAPTVLLITPPQNAGNECSSGSSLSAQVDFKNQPVDSYASSAIADLQLSGIDWEGTSFSMPPMHVNGVCADSESGVCSTSVRKHSPLHHKAAEIITPYSDSIKYDQDSPSNVACFVSDSNSPEEQNHLILKQSAVRALSMSTNASLQTVKQVKGVASPRTEFSPSSAQLNASTWETENVLSEKYPQGHGSQNSQEVLKSIEIPVQAAQKPIGSSSAVPKGLYTGTVESTCLANMLLTEPTEIFANCEVRKHSGQTAFKSSLKKSVCQNGDSSEDSDDENMKRRKPRKGSKWHRKNNLVLPKDKSNDKRSSNESTLQIKLRRKEPDFQVISTYIPAKEHPKPSSVVHVHNSPSLAESVLSMPDPHLQERGSDSEVWVRSPLPLSERLKLRMQSH
ncbi:hypothetical protein lerEdw1_008727 [Lerista edwardsae]|nr:hypothetical protein lerEdw1_008727 [Lerista edwardsae]